MHRNFEIHEMLRDLQKSLPHPSFVNKCRDYPDSCFQELVGLMEKAGWTFVRQIDAVWIFAKEVGGGGPGGGWLETWVGTSREVVALLEAAFPLPMQHPPTAETAFQHDMQERVVKALDDVVLQGGDFAGGRLETVVIGGKVWEVSLCPGPSQLPDGARQPPQRVELDMDEIDWWIPKPPPAADPPVDLIPGEVGE